MNFQGPQGYSTEDKALDLQEAEPDFVLGSVKKDLETQPRPEHHHMAQNPSPKR